jgi:hypothetical protein
MESLHKFLDPEIRQHHALLHSGIPRNFQLTKIPHNLICKFYQRLRNPERTNYSQKIRLSKNAFSFWLIFCWFFLEKFCDFLGFAMEKWRFFGMELLDLLRDEIWK